MSVSQERLLLGSDELQQQLMKYRTRLTTAALCIASAATGKTSHMLYNLSAESMHVK